MLEPPGPGSSCGDSQILLSAYDPVHRRWSVNLTQRSNQSQPLHNQCQGALQNYFYPQKSLGNGFACPVRKGSFISLINTNLSLSPLVWRGLAISWTRPHHPPVTSDDELCGQTRPLAPPPPLLSVQTAPASSASETGPPQSLFHPPRYSEWKLRPWIYVSSFLWPYFYFPFCMVSFQCINWANGPPREVGIEFSQHFWLYFSFISCWWHIHLITTARHFAKNITHRPAAWILKKSRKYKFFPLLYRYTLYQG